MVVAVSTRVAILACAALLALIVSNPVFAEKEPDADADQAAELAKKLQNPVAALISVPFQNNFEWGGGRHSEAFKYTLNFQPVIPISMSEDWNVISRTIVPVIYQDDVVPNTTQGGMGDIVQSLLIMRKIA